eukprot:UN04622
MMQQQQHEQQPHTPTRRPRPPRKESTFPHREVTTVVGIAALSYCLWGFFNNFLEQRKASIQNEIAQVDAERQRLEDLEALIQKEMLAEQAIFEMRQQYDEEQEAEQRELELQHRNQRIRQKQLQQQQQKQQQLQQQQQQQQRAAASSYSNLSLDPINPMYNNTNDNNNADTYIPSELPFPEDPNMMACCGSDDDHGAMSPPSKPSSSSRMSLMSQPASPVTKSILGKLEQIDVTGIWNELDRFGDGRVDKQTMLDKLMKLDGLGTYASEQERGIAMRKVVDKLAKGKQHITKERWQSQVEKKGTAEILNLLDDVD